MRADFPGCCARAPSGHPAAALASPAMHLPPSHSITSSARARSAWFGLAPSREH